MRSAARATLALVTDMRGVDFDDVLALLHAWQGRRVKVVVSVTVQPLEVARLNGPLGPAPDSANPYDADEWEFEVGDGGFALRRDYFTGAEFFPIGDLDRDDGRQADGGGRHTDDDGARRPAGPSPV